MTILLLKLFWTFLLIGAFGFGGGYAMISMIQAKVVGDYHWLTTSQFTDIVAVSQMTPGPIGINSATYVGYTSMLNAGYEWYWGFLGSFIATFAVVLPSFILMITISKFLLTFKDNPIVQQIFSGLRPAVVGLLLAAALCLMTKENFSSMDENKWQFIVSCLIFIFAFFSQKVYKMNPIAIIIICGLVGLILL